MKKLLALFSALAIILPPSLYASEIEKNERSAFSNLGLGISAATTGAGISLAAPLHRTLTIRAGASFTPVSYTYLYDDFPIDILQDYITLPDDIKIPNPDPIEMKAKLKMNSGHLLLDWNPFRRGTSIFFVTVGFYVSGNHMIDITGDANVNKFCNELNEALSGYGVSVTPEQAAKLIQVELGDAIIRPDKNGHVEGYLQTNSFKPYVGIGLGRQIPYRRVGFKFELGALFLGSPKIVSDNLVMTGNDGEVSKFNDLISSIKVYPQMSFAVTFRLF